MACARDFPDFSQLLPYIGGRCHQPISGHRLDIFSYLSPGTRMLVRLAPPFALVTGLDAAGTIGIVRTRPAHFVIPVVTQRVENLLMTRGRDIQRLAGFELDSRSEGVDMRCSIIITVQNGTTRVLVGIEASESGRFPILNHSLNLGGGRVVVRCPADNAAGISPLMRSGVGYLGDHRGIAAQYRYLGSHLAVMVVFLEQITNSPGGTALAVTQEFDVHDTSPQARQAVGHGRQPLADAAARGQPLKCAADAAGRSEQHRGHRRGGEPNHSTTKRPHRPADAIRWQCHRAAVMSPSASVPCAVLRADGVWGSRGRSPPPAPCL
eukprot:55748-Eustigmatos_ZCMA.PRE.3